MDKKVTMFAFNGDAMCFGHALLNVLNMKENGYDIKLIIDGSATRQVRELTQNNSLFGRIYGKVKEAGLIDCVCKSCSALTESLESAREQGLTFCEEMSGHPSIARYMDDGYQVLLF